LTAFVIRAPNAFHEQYSCRTKCVWLLLVRRKVDLLDRPVRGANIAKRVARTAKAVGTPSSETAGEVEARQLAKLALLRLELESSDRSSALRAIGWGGAILLSVVAWVVLILAVT
jgi:hypothetical protein